MYHGDGEFDTFLSLLMMLKPTAEIPLIYKLCLSKIP